MSSTKRLIINADDFGRTPGINRGVVEAHERGVVSSATMMVNYPPAAEAAELARRNPSLGVGLHVALTGGPPALPPQQIPSLVDAQGRLFAKPEGLVDVKPEEVLAEARAQLRRFRELMGRDPTHMDSHHHSHRESSAVLDALCTLAWETGMPIRNNAPEVQDRLKREGIRTNDHFVEEFYDQGVTRDALVRILGELKPGTTELMCHPAVVDQELRDTSGYAEQRTRELEVLTHPDIRQMVQAAGIQLTTFASL
jgi:chitin disaccharide deacetylase